MLESDIPDTLALQDIAASQVLDTISGRQFEYDAGDCWCDRKLLTSTKMGTAAIALQSVPMATSIRFCGFG